MTLHLDLPTVILVYNTSLIAGALSIVQIRRHSCRPQGLAYLAVAYLLLALGSIVAWSGENAVLPVWLWTHGSLLFGLGGYTFFWVGLRQFSGRQRIQWRVIWLLPAAVLVLGVVTGFPLQNLTRAGGFHAAAALVLAVCTFDTLRDRRHEPLPSRTLLASFAGTEWQHLCPAAGVHRCGYCRIGWFRVGLLCADALSLWHRAGWRNVCRLSCPPKVLSLSWISTGSNKSMTALAMPLATMCWSLLPVACKKSCAVRICWHALVVRSS